MQIELSIEKTLYYDSESNALYIIDQTLLPKSAENICLKSVAEICDAIRKLKVRGAPAIGAAAAYGVLIGAKELALSEFLIERFMAGLEEICTRLNRTRPTAVNLSRATDRMLFVASKAKTVAQAIEILKCEAAAIEREDIESCNNIGKSGVPLIKDGMGVLTHCNAGKLATCGIGTALAPIYLAFEAGARFRVYADETRPLLQGARLTASELFAAGIDVTLICDSMASSLMKSGQIDIILVGCDRVAANGDTANKIGTLGLAVCAKRFGVPFYICAPDSTIDPLCQSGENIKIEMRDRSEITQMWYEKPMVPDGVKVYNPSFDVTDAELITGFITERGIIYPDYNFAEELYHKNEKSI